MTEKTLAQGLRDLAHLIEHDKEFAEILAGLSFATHFFDYEDPKAKLDEFARSTAAFTGVPAETEDDGKYVQVQAYFGPLKVRVQALCKDVAS